MGNFKNLTPDDLPLDKRASLQSVLVEAYKTLKLQPRNPKCDDSYWTRVSIGYIPNTESFITINCRDREDDSNEWTMVFTINTGKMTITAKRFNAGDVFSVPEVLKPFLRELTHWVHQRYKGQEGRHSVKSKEKETSQEIGHAKLREERLRRAEEERKKWQEEAKKREETQKRQIQEFIAEEQRHAKLREERLRMAEEQKKKWAAEAKERGEETEKKRQELINQKIDQVWEAKRKSKEAEQEKAQLFVGDAAAGSNVGSSKEQHAQMGMKRQVFPDSSATKRQRMDSDGTTCARSAIGLEDFFTDDLDGLECYGEPNSPNEVPEHVRPCCEEMLQICEECDRKGCVEDTCHNRDGYSHDCSKDTVGQGN